MKYGILTYHNIPNIGAVLQAHALCEKIRELGYDCEIIDYTCENIVKRELQFHPLNNAVKSLIYRTLFWPQTIKKAEACADYMQRQRIISTERYTRATINKANSYYDGFISGSDMIWNTKINDHDYTFFLDFVMGGKKKISYGSSIGDVWSKDEEETVKEFLKSYESLSVREEDTCQFIRNELQLPCRVVADPTMLLTGKEWEKFSKKTSYKDYVLVYFANKPILKAAQDYAEKRDKTVLVMNWDVPTKGYKNIHPYSPDEWIGLFHNCDAVFTNSYHGLLFSLYFNKPVWTANSGNRQKTILSRLGINEALITEENRCDSEIFNFQEIELKLEKIRSESIEYLTAALA